MYGYVSLFTWITGAVILIGLLILWIFPTHYKKVALLFWITGMIQIIISGFIYYPYHIFVVIPLPFVVVGIIALLSGALIAIYGSTKRKKVEDGSKNSS